MTSGREEEPVVRSGVWLFESPSVLQTFFLLPRLRSAHTVYHHRTNHFRLDLATVRRWISSRMVRLVNPKVRILDLPGPIFYGPALWNENRLSAGVVARMRTKIETTASFRMAKQLIDEDEIIRYFQMLIASYFPIKRILGPMGAELARGGETVFIVPDPLTDLWPELFPMPGAGSSCVRAVRLPIVNFVRGIVWNTAIIGFYLVWPLIFVAARMRRLQIRPIRRRRFAVRMPIHHGFRENDDTVHGIRTENDDRLLYGAELGPGRIVHVFSEWKYPLVLEEKYREIMEHKGLAWAHRKDFLIDPGMLVVVLKTFLAGILLTLRAPSSKDPLQIRKLGALFLAHVLEKKLEHANLEYGVEFLRNDYMAPHVIATALLHQSGGKTVGTQHANVPELSPSLCFVHIDHYVVAGDVYVRPYLPFWEERGIRLEKIGRNSTDRAIKALAELKANESLSARFRSLHGSKRPVVLMVLPSGEEYVRREKWEELRLALDRLGEEGYKGQIFLRFRSASFDQQYPHLAPFRDLARRHSFIRLDHENFTTQELMALSDVVIANCASFAINEAVAIGRPVFSFGLLGISRYFFPDYGRDFVLETADDLLRVFRGAGDARNLFDCDWARLKQVCNYHDDGGNLDRLRSLVREVSLAVESRREAEG